MNAHRPEEQRPAILLSFDAEEFDIPLEYGHRLPESEQFRIGADGLERALQLLAESGVRATFFTTAALARRSPDLVRRAAREGHEIASHAFYHSRFEPGHLRQSREVLQEIAGVGVVGFRMPRMAPVSPALIREAGYRYDSSVNPIWLPGRYNRFFEKRNAYTLDGLVRIPLAATPLVRWPLFWLAFKNQPRWLNRVTTRATLAADGYAALYFHPWELMSNLGFGLPRVIERTSGQAMCDALREHLRWLGSKYRFITYADFVRERFAG
ncbi:MAG: polysaccharide deacetylase family protein [Phycisphaerae bacterium]|nr:polysaccharide deacetylase family protein [Phycisphaerae bacterium]MBN8596242.1 polysaccharide deacetylase family protein [Planctomycetota bacterium]